VPSDDADAEGCFTTGNGGATTTFVVTESQFDLVFNEDYVIDVRGRNDYGNAGPFTQGQFSTDTSRREMLRASNATAARGLTQGGRYLLVEADIAAATDREFTFGALGYDECCEVRVQTNAANCESEVAVAECCTFIDCPEVPQVECSLVVTTDTDDDETCIEVVAEWDAPASGNVDHIGEWMVASTETTVGKYVCGTSDTACGLVVPFGGLEVCDQTVEDFCMEDGDTTTLWQACAPQCQAMYDLVEFFSGVIVHE